QDKPTDAWWSMERGLSRELIDALGRLRETPVAADSSATQALTRVQASLPADAVLVGWLEGRRGGSRYREDPYWCYAIRAQGPLHWVRVDAPSGDPMLSSHGDVDAAVRCLRHSSAWPYRIPESSQFDALARSIYKQRLMPLEPWIHDAKLLIIGSPTY